jgi:hypothetical protein
VFASTDLSGFCNGEQVPAQQEQTTKNLPLFPGKNKLSSIFLENIRTKSLQKKANLVSS